MAIAHAEPLAPEELGLLTSYESVIAAGLASYVEVGTALERIREARLYRAEYGSFAEYCVERWGFSRRYADQLVQAAAVARDVAYTGRVPDNASQARALAAVEPDERAEIWSEVVEATEGEVTTEAVERAVRDRTFRAGTQAGAAIQGQTENSLFSNPSQFDARTAGQQLRSLVLDFVESWPAEHHYHAAAMLRRVSTEIELRIHQGRGPA